jgi:hypothetical protein
MTQANHANEACVLGRTEHPSFDSSLLGKPSRPHPPPPHQITAITYDGPSEATQEGAAPHMPMPNSNANSRTLYHLASLKYLLLHALGSYTCAGISAQRVADGLIVDCMDRAF